MSYGTPASLDELEAYYTHIRRGRAPGEEQLAELRARYEAIGGTSPLTAITRAQGEGIQRALDRARPDVYRIYLGAKHSSPFIEDAVASMRADDVTRAVGLVLAPHYAAASVGEYVRRAAEAAGDDVRCNFVTSWHLASGYLDVLAGALRAALAQVPDGSHVLFTAHSLPSRVVHDGDDYAGRVEETAAAVADAVGLASWSVAWQSAGRTDDEWLGPDVVAVIGDLARDGVPGVVVCACGFVADHLEVLYDLDVEAAAAAQRAGISFARTAMPNADGAFTEMLAQLVLDAAAELRS